MPLELILDTLSYIDDDISVSDRENSEAQITEELKKIHQTALSSKVEKLLPSIPLTNSLLNLEIGKLEKLPKKNLKTIFNDYTMGGVDMSRYSNLYEDSNNENLDHLRAYVALAYTSNRLRSNNLLGEYGKNHWLRTVDDTSNILGLLERNVEKKRKDVEEINSNRKKQQLDAQPRLSYLEEQWEKGVKSCLEVGIAVEELNNS